MRWGESPVLPKTLHVTGEPSLWNRIVKAMAQKHGMRACVKLTARPNFRSVRHTTATDSHAPS